MLEAAKCVICSEFQNWMHARTGVAEGRMLRQGRMSVGGCPRALFFKDEASAQPRLLRRVGFSSARVNLFLIKDAVSARESS